MGTPLRTLCQRAKISLAVSGMKKSLFLLLIGSVFLSSVPLMAAAPTSFAKHEVRPKLIVVLVIDQCRSDFLTRFAKRMDANRSSGLGYLMKNGAYYPNAKFDMLQSMTCPGHAAVLTGAYPNQMGIPLNEWYDTSKKEEVYCAADRLSPIVGRAADEKEGMSPRRLVGSTVGDELKMAGYGTKTVAIALKDRSAIMMGGHLANLSLWLEEGKWVSSKYYLKDGKLPEWVSELNRRLESERGQVFEWEVPGVPSGLTSPAAERNKKVKVVIDAKQSFATQYGVKVTTDAAIKALAEFKLGKGPHTDILAVSYSSHDLLGHQKGLQAPEMEDLTMYEDESIGLLIDAIDSAVGLRNVVFAMTGDHGVAPAVQAVKPMGIDAGTFDKSLVEAAGEHLEKKFGKSKAGPYILRVRSFNFYLDPAAIAGKKLRREDVEAELKAFLLQPKTNGEVGRPGVAEVFTRSEFEKKLFPTGRFGRQLRNTYIVGKSGDVVLIPKPFWVSEGAFATHLTGYEYDRSVPLILAGERFKAGVYAQSVEVIDLAPTLSHILGLVAPSGADGRVLHESLK
ncbi:MAG: alkaline phosphatase family protein [Bdellovibrionales bacterium]|nr:alkaline phosphatase family protein [Bdellovibrionales bacterium]